MPRGWTWAPVRPSRVPPDVKSALSAKARELIGSMLVPTHVKPPPKKPRFNYIVGFETRWHGGFFYFVAVTPVAGWSHIQAQRGDTFLGWTTSMRPLSSIQVSTA